MTSTRSTADAAPASHGGARAQRRHVLAIVAASGAIALAYSLLLPLFIAPDEHVHVDMVGQVVTEGGFATRGEAWIGQQTIRAQRELGMTRPVRPGVQLRRFLVEDATSRPDRPSFDDLGTTQDTHARNYIANHGPTYYLATGVATRLAMSFAPEGVWSFDREILLMRWVNVAMLMATTGATYALARSFGLGHRGGLLAMVLPLGIPQYLHIGSTVNSDNLFVLASTLLTLAAVRLVQPDPETPLRADAALLAGVSATLAILSKTQGRVALLAVAALAVWLWRSKRSGRTAALIRLLAPVLLVAAPGAALRQFRGSRLADAIGEGSTNEAATADLGRWAGEYLNLMSRTFWGAFGWLDAALPWRTTHLFTLVGTVVVLASIVVLWRSKGRWRLAVWAFALLAPAATAAASLLAHLDNGGMRAMQGRYLFPVVPLAACTIVFAATRVSSRFPGRRALVAPVLGLAISASILWLHAGAVRVVLDRHWGPDRSTLAGSWDALAAWAPTPVWLTVTIFVLGLGGVALVVATPTVVTLTAVRRAADRQSA